MELLRAGRLEALESGLRRPWDGVDGEAFHDWALREELRQSGANIKARQRRPQGPQPQLLTTPKWPVATLRQLPAHCPSISCALLPPTTPTLLKLPPPPHHT